jgi:hypothetical protein
VTAPGSPTAPRRGFLTLGDVAAADWPALFDRAAQLKACLL